MGDVTNVKILYRYEFGDKCLETGSRAGIKYDGKLKEYKRIL